MILRLRFNWAQIGFLILIVSTSCKVGFMKWERRPIPEIEKLSTTSVLEMTGGRGFSGGSLFTEESMRERDFRKGISMDTSVIYETTDDWITRRSVYRGSGEIVAFFKIEPNACVAQNSRYSKEDLQESSHFIRWNDGHWEDVSILNLESVKVWGSGGPWMLAAGRLEDGSGSISLSISSDGALTWQHVDLDGYNPLAKGRDPSLYLTAEGLLYRTIGASLERFDLRSTHGIGRWEKLRELPINFNSLAIAGWGKAVEIFGSLPDNKFGLINAFEKVDLVTVGWDIPEKFLLTAFSMREHLCYLVGSLEIKTGTETIGFENMILVSENQGESWRNTDLPLKASLNAYDFGSDGKIWAVAAGNRMQVLPSALERSEP